MKERGLINAPSDPRTNGTRQLYFAQQWGRNAIFINTDCRSYRDIRMKTAMNADETGTRANNPNRTMLGATQLAWLEQTLLDAERTGTTWKFINISDPIDQIGPIGGSLTLVNPPTTADYGTLGSITSIVTTGSTNNARTVTVASTVGLVTGQGVFGAGIPANTTINTTTPMVRHSRSITTPRLPAARLSH
jgi:phosphodiesterase/alkaline phosphatase D-like protein